MRAAGLVYMAGDRSSLQAVIVEGEKCADAAAHFLGALRVVALVGAMPDGATLAWALAGCAEVAIWPDYDVPGVAYRDKLLKVLPEAVPGAKLREMRSLALNPKAVWNDGFDAADWRPAQGKAEEEFDAACRPVGEPAPEAAAPIMRPAAEWIEDVRKPADEELTPAGPGLLYRGRTVLPARAPWGSQDYLCGLGRLMREP